MSNEQMPSNALQIVRRIRACESEVPAQIVFEHALRASAKTERSRWDGVEQYLIAAADGSMSRNNSETLAAELLATIPKKDEKDKHEY